MKREDYFRLFSTTLIRAWLVLFALIPTLLVLATTLLEPGDLELLRLQFTLKNYLTLIDPLYLRVFFRSFALAGICTLICLFLAYPFSYILSRLPKNIRGFLLLLVIIPLWTSSLIRSYAIIAVLKTHGILNNLLIHFGVINEPMQLMYTQTAVLVGLVYSLLPLMVLPLYANIEKLDRRLIDAAQDLGASKYHIFSSVIFPLTLPGILAGCMLVFLPAMTIFYIPDLMGGAKTLLLGNMIQNQFLTARNWPMGATLSMVLIIVMGVLMLFYFRSKDPEAGDPIR